MNLHAADVADPALLARLEAELSAVDRETLLRKLEHEQAMGWPEPYEPVRWELARIFAVLTEALGGTDPFYRASGGPHRVLFRGRTAV